MAARFFPPFRHSAFAAFFLTVAPAVFVAATPEAALAAENAAAVNKVTNLNRKALEAYSKQDYDTARSLLKEALEVCASSGLDQHPIRARTHIHFGAVAITGFNQREVGIKQFRKALEVQPDIKLTKSIVTPDLQDAFEEAVLAGEGGGGAAPGGGGEGRPPMAQADDDDGESRPSVRKAKPVPRKKKGGDGDDDDEDDEGGGEGGGFFFGLGVGTGFGLASGSAELDPNLHKLEGPGFAMAQAGHVAPEVGYFISSDLLLSFQVRYQYITGVNGKPQPPGTTGCDDPTYCKPFTSALAGLAKVTYFLGKGDFRFTVGGQVGGGRIRHAVVFDDNTCGPKGSQMYTTSCVDTLGGGPFLIGPTAGFVYSLSEMANLFLGLNSAIGAPSFTLNFDLTAGIGFRV